MRDSFVLAIFVRNVFRSDKYYRRYVRDAFRTHVGLYVKYSLLTKGITCRLQILVEHTSIIFNRFYFASRFMTFRSRFLADFWGRTDGQTGQS